MFFDPLYLLFMIPGMLLAFWASYRTKKAFKKYSQVRTMSGMTGAEAAAMMLSRAGISDVKIVPTKGVLSDHYNPVTKTLALSEPVYGTNSIAAVGVACHEAGHAIQHATHYAALWARSALVPAANIGSKFGYWVALIGMVMGANNMILLGAALFSLLLVFQIVTLPVEFDASARAKKLAFEHGIVTAQERDGVATVLNAAALTYVAAAVTTLLTVIYFVLRARR